MSGFFDPQRITNFLGAQVDLNLSTLALKEVSFSMVVNILVNMFWRGEGCLSFVLSTSTVWYLALITKQK